MRTFALTLGLDMHVVVPEQFTEELYKQAREEDTTPFLKDALAKFENDPEAFTLHILKNGIRKETRNFLLAFLGHSGLGGTLSPASLRPIDRSPPTDVKPALATEIAQAIPA